MMCHGKDVETFSFYLKYTCCLDFFPLKRGGRRRKHQISWNKNKHNNRTCDQIRSSLARSFAYFSSLLLRFWLPHVFFFGWCDVGKQGRRRCIFFVWLTTDSLGMWSIAFISCAQSMWYNKCVHLFYRDVPQLLFDVQQIVKRWKCYNFFFKVKSSIPIKFSSMGKNYQ